LFLERIGVELSKEWREVDKEQLYEASWGGGKWGIFLLGMGEAKFWFCLLKNVEFLWILIVISWGQKSFWTSSFLEPCTWFFVMPRTSGRKYEV
jgi:hypothetical protein